MDSRLKQRLVGAAVLVALAVIFLPMLVKGPAPDSGVSDLSLDVPDAPATDFRTIELPLVTPPAPADGGALPAPPQPDDAQVTTVDTSDAGEALPAATGAGNYVVHFGSFATEANADTILRHLREREQMQGYREAHTLNGRQAWRVRLGPYATQAEAEAVRVRAAQLREDVNPRVVALDAETPSSPQPSPPTRTEPAPSQPSPSTAQAPAATPEPQRPAPQAPVAPAAASDVGFIVQVGAFRNAADANALRDRLRGQGFTAFTDTVQTDNGRLTRVKAGPVSSRAEADRLKAQLKSRANLDGIVRSHP